MRSILKRSPRLCLFGLLAFLVACAHRPASPAGPPAPPPVWPPAPAKPIARWWGSFPDPDRPRPEPGFWRKVLDAIVGIDDERSVEERTFERPFGITAIPGGFVAADPGNGKLLRVFRSELEATPLACRSTDWKLPIAVATAPGGDLYVADAGEGVVVRLRGKDDCLAIGKGALERPTGVVWQGELLYVVDSPRHQVVVFDREGVEQRRFGARGDEGAGLNYPSGIAAAEDGSLLVVDSLNFRIARYSADGTFLGAFGEPGDGSGAFGRPKAVAAGKGRLFVTDTQHDVVVVFSGDGLFEASVGSAGRGPGGLTLPAGVAVGDGFMYVADSFGRRIEIFELLGGDGP